MFQIFKIWNISVFLCLILFSNCTNPAFEEPEIPLENYQIEENFNIEVIASEALITAPVAMDFDEKGRIWLVEMNGYMSNIDGTDEDAPNGRIVILEDLDNDGKTDHTKVFLDGLVLPRALLLVYGGVLYAEPPNLWFIERNGDQPGQKQLVDNQYAIGGNVEHQPNGLLRHLDNWVYSGRSTARYKKIGKRWIKEEEPLRFRGQWGLTSDNIGRLFFNDNSNPLYADYVNPNILTRNEFYVPTEGVFEHLMSDRRIWPLHATAINRGYIPGMLDEKGFVVNFTAACGPVIYRGDQFPNDYNGNAFVCEPAASLVKRYLISEKGYEIECNQAYENREFLATTDEGFRPVNLYNGPDGCLYALDFHRGVIQHKIYLTSYLREKLLERKLDTVVDFGRILRISHQSNPIPDKPDFTKIENEELVEMLGHQNGWIRDKAQQFLVEKDAKEVKNQIEEKATDGSNYLGQIHALWTLKGLGILNFETPEKAFESEHPDVKALVIRLSESFYNAENYEKIQSLLTDAFELNHPKINLQLGASLGIIAQKNGDFSFELLRGILKKHPEDNLLNEAVISGLSDLEEAFLDYLKKYDFEDNSLIINILNQVVQNKTAPPKAVFAAGPRRDRKSIGLDLYRIHCESCHGPSGYGISNIAPPLYGSDWVEGDPRKLMLVALHGLAGPVHVNGTLYNINNVMPGVKDHPDLTDADLANLLTFVRNGFGKEPYEIKENHIREMRKIEPDGGIFTEESLKKYLSEN